MAVYLDKKYADTNYRIEVVKSISPAVLQYIFIFL